MMKENVYILNNGDLLDKDLDIII